jgi:hypothetical protein
MEIENQPQQDPEINAIGVIYLALKDLEEDARARVLSFVSNKLNQKRPKPDQPDRQIREAEAAPYAEPPAVADDEMDGISPAGRKWIARNGISPSSLGQLFSLGIDEIDLVSKQVPGEKKAQRLRNVFLLKGIAAYLGTGTARFTHEQVKEACSHYDAWDGSNFAVTLKSMNSDVSGTKEVGYTLTAKGLSEGTTLVKKMLGGNSSD